MFYKKKYFKLKEERMSLELTLNQLQASKNLFENKLHRKCVEVSCLKDKIRKMKNEINN